MGKRAPDFDGFILNDAHTPTAPPVDLDGRCFCGALDIRIDARGQWYYNSTPIRRKDMTCLFASMLMKDEAGRYWLVTPTEVGCIDVDDAPFVAIDLFVHGAGREQCISLTTNIDETVTIGPATPLAMRATPDGRSVAPYVTCENGLEIKIPRTLYYDLVDLGTVERVEPTTTFGVWSGGTFFPLGPAEDAPTDAQSHSALQGRNSGSSRA